VWGGRQQARTAHGSNGAAGVLTASSWPSSTRTHSPDTPPAPSPFAPRAAGRDSADAYTDRGGSCGWSPADEAYRLDAYSPGVRCGAADAADEAYRLDAYSPVPCGGTATTSPSTSAWPPPCRLSSGSASTMLFAAGIASAGGGDSPQPGARSPRPPAGVVERCFHFSGTAVTVPAARQRGKHGAAPPCARTGAGRPAALRAAVPARRGGQPDGAGRGLWTADLWHAELIQHGAALAAARWEAGLAGEPRGVALVVRPADPCQGPARRGRWRRRAGGGRVARAHAVRQRDLGVRERERGDKRKRGERRGGGRGGEREPPPPVQRRRLACRHLMQRGRALLACWQVRLPVPDGWANADGERRGCAAAPGARGQHLHHDLHEREGRRFASTSACRCNSSPGSSAVPGAAGAPLPQEQLRARPSPAHRHSTVAADTQNTGTLPLCTAQAKQRRSGPSPRWRRSRCPTRSRPCSRCSSSKCSSSRPQVGSHNSKGSWRPPSQHNPARRPSASPPLLLPGTRSQKYLLQRL